MAATPRLVAATAVILFAGGAAVAQVPTAPPPHPALDELVREYRRLGLPEPPRDAEFVRIGFRSNNPERSSFLAFRVPPPGPRRLPRYWENGRVWARANLPDWDESANPDPTALDRVHVGDADHHLVLAVQCQARGWHDLARAIYSHARAKLAEGGEERSPVEILRDRAWFYWEYDRLNEPGADRREPLRRLRALAAEDARFRTAENDDLLGALEFTIESPRARPGSVEALIDALTEHPNAPDGTILDRPAQEAYVKLVELGFAAVPALIEHIRDPRVTRAHYWAGNLAVPYRIRVGHVAVELLAGLVGSPADRLWVGSSARWDEPGGKTDPEQARRWWAEARAVGEEKWLIDSAMPDNSNTPNPFVARVIRAKYPNRLPEVYRTILRDRPEVSSYTYSTEVRASTLPRGAKIALFEEGVGHADPDHKYYALEALGRIDPPRIRAPVLRILQAIPGDNADPVRPWAGGLVRLVESADDRECWAALVTALPKLTVDDRRAVIWAVSDTPAAGAADPHRRERLRVLRVFLDDPAQVVDEYDERGIKTEVRDYAADRLASLLGFWPKYDDEIGNEVNRERGPLCRAILRAAVRHAAERELR